jgi:3-oxoacyl-[acyl-carrier-protein] synthase-1
MGIVSCIGNRCEDVLLSLRESRSGIRRNESYVEHGLRSLVSGAVDFDGEALIDRRIRRFMAPAAMYAYVAMRDAIADAGLEESQVSHPRTGLIASAGGASSANIVTSADIARSRGMKKVGPYMVTRTMGSAVAACLATPFKIKGVSYGVTSACATSAHSVGNAMELIQIGKQDIVFAGGAEEDHWTQAVMFDAMGALTTKHNDTPETASRPYDVTRDGFVIAEGGGMLVVEALDHALDRGAHIYAEITGYGATSDGQDMVAPSGEGAIRCMRIATETARRPLDYINTHGTSTPAGDITELLAIREALGDTMPRVSSTKGLTGHSLGATGVQEAIYCLLMLQHDFIAPTSNILELDPKAEGLPLVLERRDQAGLQAVMTNSFGFGGTNAALVFERYEASCGL